ncbi:DNA polymerase III subunit alpha [Lujinxingia vulgaris]|uniref:DNA-directed DNA polymerase n=1 Tax=Lujinxingia vulgaris TaxID=2600176 RepID=A0A5C6X588_9DELT|nr:error-prone DNA polymerase [Lujinxingia vulgaris]TXD36308.1 DNA polymerase III subunit alpha [Lujinxingia vulgaris]
MTYVPLFNKSNGSFLEGASHPEELVDQCAELGLPALAICDRDGVYGAVRAFQRARQLDLKLIVGSQITLDDGTTIILLAQTRRGYANLGALITRGRLRCEKGKSQVRWQEVAEHADDLLALWGGPESLLWKSERPDHVASLLGEAFGDRLYALITRHQTEDEQTREPLIFARAERYGLSCVGATEVLYHRPERRPLQDILTCIRHTTELSKAGNLLRPNDLYTLTPPADLARRFADRPDLLERTLEVASRCTFSMGELRYSYPIEALPEGHTPDSWLRALTLKGARQRYDGIIPTEVLAQVERELGIITQLQYAGYFLTMKEIVEFCRAQNILCQGRGSAANSAVCFCLGITAVDPVRMGLLFERFISPERAEPPDIDLDIAHERREEVIQHVYARYGRQRAAMVANVIRYRPRSAVRDVGKALGLPEALVDRLARLLGHRGQLGAETWEQAELDPTLPLHRHLETLTNAILDFPRHLSIHPGGFILAEERVSDLVPVENASMENRTVIQWDKYDVEALGLFKVDLLGLGALTMIDRAFRLLERHHQRYLDLASIPTEDPATFDMICRGDTLGVFQIESRAQMAMLPRLKPRTYYDLVIEISLVRPGPITGDMVHPYLRRRQGLEPVDYPHESLVPVLERTLGIPLFQEQVMKLAIVAADYTPGEADQLRRDMAAWKQHGRIERHRERLITRMIEKGIEPDFAERVFSQIQGFADYGFPESHAASFALLAYATSWLRCHHPVVFAAALLNSQPMGFYSTSTIVEDARRRGVEVRSIDVHLSEWDCTLEPTDTPPFDFALRMGLRQLRGFSQQAAERLIDARRDRHFESVEDLMRRANLATNDHQRLARAGALSSIGVTRRQALWEITGRPTELDALSLPIDVRDPAPTFQKLSRLEAIEWDHRTSFHSTRGHPLQELRPLLKAQGLPCAEQLNALAHKTRVHFAALVICRQRPSTASGVVFMTLEDETGLANIVIYPRVFERFAVLARTTPFIGISGTIQHEQGVTHLIADQLWRPRLESGPPKVRSRDFH